jgi:hypothetical protein
MTDETIKQIKNAGANTIQLTDYVNDYGNDYFTNFNGNTKIYDDKTKNNWRHYKSYRPGDGRPIDTETINELKQKYIDTADELTLGGRRRPTRKNSKKSAKRVYVRSHRIGITRYASAAKSHRYRRRK